MSHFWRRIYRLASRRVLAGGTPRHVVPTLAHSQEDLIPSAFLVDLAARVIPRAFDTALTCGKADLPDSAFFNTFPGEHYRLLAACVAELGAASVVEIGTWTGQGTVALASALPEGGWVTTFDIVAWDRLGVPSHLTEPDFASGRVVQELADISDPALFERYRSILTNADLIFLDAPKDGRFEYRMLDLLGTLAPRAGRLLIIDDIRFVNMIDFWRSIASPKLDMTGFGHFSGTGFVDLSEGLKQR